jgi:murein L,D-transpeptidase YcbB/YkuD
LAVLAAVLAITGALVAAASIIGSGSSDRPAPRAAPAASAVAAPVESPAAAAERRRIAGQQRTQTRLAVMGDRILGPGATGPDVKMLQRLVGVPATGSYGPKTQSAVLEFQIANGLHADGNAGVKTKRLLARRPPAR